MALPGSVAPCSPRHAAGVRLPQLVSAQSCSYGRSCTATARSSRLARRSNKRDRQAGLPLEVGPKERQQAPGRSASGATPAPRSPSAPQRPLACRAPNPVRQRHIEWMRRGSVRPPPLRYGGGCTTRSSTASSSAEPQVLELDRRSPNSATGRRASGQRRPDVIGQALIKTPRIWYH